MNTDIFLALALFNTNLGLENYSKNKSQEEKQKQIYEMIERTNDNVEEILRILKNEQQQ